MMFTKNGRSSRVLQHDARRAYDGRRERRDARSTQTAAPGHRNKTSAGTTTLTMSPTAAF